jgi:aerobic-type carbon monoxide dehydrogenase small subunit (CoxS/CutS family)
VATISLTVNGRSISLDADPEMPLLWALRDSIGLVGTKFGCGGGFCGACTVHVDGAATRSCTLPLSRAAGHAIVTIEGLASTSGVGRRAAGVENALHPVQRAWVDLDVPQCGYCQAGQIMTAAALLARTPNPSDEQIASAMQGNLCRCGTYMRIREAVKRAAAQTNSGGAR